VIKRLISYLDEQDFTSIVSPTMDILMRIPFQTRMADLVIKLMENQHASVRQFAIKKMRELNSPKVVRVLIDYLASPESMIRDLAAESLCWLDSARTILLERILQEEDLDLCCLYAKILKPHAPKLRSNQIKQLYNHLTTLMDKDSRLQEPLIFLIKTAAPDFLHESLISRAKKLKKQKKYEEVVKTLKLLQMNGRLDQEATFEFAVCQLKNATIGLKSEPSDSDPSLYLFHQLSKDPEFPLQDRILGEKLLDREEVYYVASYFMKKLRQERLVGSALLETLAKKHPRSKAGLASRKMLKAAEL
jgi:hypothetical protein